MKQGVLLINLGSPDAPTTSAVRTYLTEFLNDPRVIDISPAGRFFLVNGIIVPFRSPKTAALYKKIWRPEGSPLIIYSKKFADKLQNSLGKDFVVSLGMRYRNPSIKSALEKLRKEKVEKITVVPMYPQYASSSTGTVTEEVYKLLKEWEVVPQVKVISKFYDHPAYINEFISLGKKFNLEEFDHVLFSFHGLPERQILKASNHYGNGYCQLGKCCNGINQNNHHCYRAASFYTARKIAEGLNLPEEKYTVAFQSRLGRDPWIKPYSDHVLEEKAKAGIKKILVFSPAFVADCLETIYEIGTEYDHLFKEFGGEKVTLVPSLNDNDSWVEGFKDILFKN